jgi:hypothetical protein
LHVGRDFSAKRPFPRLDVPPMKIDKMLPGDSSQPRVERKWPVTSVRWQSASGFHQGLLDYVRGVHPSGHARVHAYRDHSPEPRSVAVHEALDCAIVTFARSEEKLFSIGILRQHEIRSLMQNT